MCKERVGPGGSLFVVGIPVGGGRRLGYLPSFKFLGVCLWVLAYVVLGVLCFDLIWGLLPVAFIRYRATLPCARVLCIAGIFGVCDVVRRVAVVS